MGFALIFVGILLALSAVRGTTGDLARLVTGDLTGSGSFVWWLVVLMLIGVIGYIPPFRLLSRAFLAIVILALLLTKGNPNLPQGGLFGQFNAELSKATATSQGSNIAPPAATLQTVSEDGLPSLPPLISV